jgi:hypothetical protein
MQPEDLEYRDAPYEVIITARAVKPIIKSPGTS